MRRSLCVLVLAGCGNLDAVDAVRAAFPAHAAHALGEQSAPFVAQAGEALDVRLPADATGSVVLRLRDGFTIQVHEAGLFDAGIAELGHVRYGRADGTVFWSRSGRALEEWLHIHAPTAGVVAEWEILGGSLLQRGVAVVAIVDDAGRERVRVSAPAAFGASGASLHLALKADGSRIVLIVDEAVRSEDEILVDPIWSAVDMATPRREHTATVLPNGRVLVAGGTGASGALSSCEIYDAHTGLWSPAHAMQSARTGHTAALVGDGNVLVTGGRGPDGSAMSSAELYTPSTDTWVVVAR